MRREGTTPCIDCEAGAADLPARVCHDCQVVRAAVAQATYTGTPITTWLHPRSTEPPAKLTQERLL